MLYKYFRSNRGSFNKNETLDATLMLLYYYEVAIESVNYESNTRFLSWKHNHSKLENISNIFVIFLFSLVIFVAFCSVHFFVLFLLYTIILRGEISMYNLFTTFSHPTFFISLLSLLPHRLQKVDKWL